MELIFSWCESIPDEHSLLGAFFLFCSIPLSLRTKFIVYSVFLFSFFGCYLGSTSENANSKWILGWFYRAPYLLYSYYFYPFLFIFPYLLLLLFLYIIFAPTAVHSEGNRIFPFATASFLHFSLFIFMQIQIHGIFLVTLIGSGTMWIALCARYAYIAHIFFLFK